MSLFVLDTDVLSLWQHAHPSVSQNVTAHKADDLAITAITVQEQLDGWHSRLPHAKAPQQIADLYQRLVDNVVFVGRLNILPYSVAAVLRYEQLQRQKLNISRMDLKIAAIVLEAGATLVTRNFRDFGRIPGLAIADWTK